VRYAEPLQEYHWQPFVWAAVEAVERVESNKATYVPHLPKKPVTGLTQRLRAYYG